MTRMTTLWVVLGTLGAVGLGGYTLYRFRDAQALERDLDGFVRREQLRVLDAVLHELDPTA